MPIDDARSNAGMAYERFIDGVPIHDDHIHRVDGRLAPETAADDYRDELADFFGDQLPAFDLVQLGLGDDGHTASLFPGDDALAERDRWAVATDAADPPRVTLTYPVLNNAKTVVFMVTDADKAEMLREVLEGPHVPRELPAQGIAPAGGDLYWFVTEGAAAALSGNA